MSNLKFFGLFLWILTRAGLCLAIDWYINDPVIAVCLLLLSCFYKLTCLDEVYETRYDCDFVQGEPVNA